MPGFLNYSPYVCIGIVLAILFVIWAFYGGKKYDFIGLAPINPETAGKYTGSIYEWGNEINGNNEPEPEIIHFNDETPCFIFEENPLAERIRNDNRIIANMKGPEAKGSYGSKGERICCETMEKIYGVPFKKIRPHWLKNPETGRNLELDCYNEDLQLAVEYNGKQHYEYNERNGKSTSFHKGEKDFINQVRRDNYKAELCARNGIYLIIVPHTIAHEDIFDYILSKLPETVQNRVKSDTSNITTF